MLMDGAAAIGRGIGVGRAAVVGAAVEGLPAAVGAAVTGAALVTGTPATGAAGAGVAAATAAGDGILMVGAAVGFGGKLIRTVSFFGCTLADSEGLGGTGTFGVFSAIYDYIECWLNLGFVPRRVNWLLLRRMAEPASLPAIRQHASVGLIALASSPFAISAISAPSITP
jgi:hypothetical protein